MKVYIFKYAIFNFQVILLKEQVLNAKILKDVYNLACQN